MGKNQTKDGLRDQLPAIQGGIFGLLSMSFDQENLEAK